MSTKIYNYGGKEYKVDATLSDEEIEKKIKDYLVSTGQSETVANVDNQEGTYEDPKYEGFLTEMGEGVISGLIGIGQGIGELGELVTDAVGITDIETQFVKDNANNLRNKLGVDPAGLTGKITEGIVQFGVPGVAVAAGISRGSKLLQPFVRKNVQRAAKLQRQGRTISKKAKFNIAAEQVVAAGITDAIVATDGTQTVSDFFEDGPFQTDRRVGLTGFEETKRRLANKLAIGAESAIATTVLPFTIKHFINATAKTAAAKIPGVNVSAAEVVSYLPKKGIEKASNFLEASADRLTKGESGGLDRLLGIAVSSFRNRGLLDPVTGKMRSLIDPAVEGDIKIAQGNLKRVDKLIDKELKKPKHRDLTSHSKAELLNKFMSVLEGAPGFTSQISAERIGISDELLKAFREAKKTIDGLSLKILDTETFKRLPEVAPENSNVMTQQKFKDIVMSNITSGGYLQRRYEVFNNKNYDITGAARRVLIDKIKGRVKYGDDKSSIVNIEDFQKQMRGPDVPNTFKMSDQDVEAYKNGTYEITEKQADLYISQKLANAKKAAGFNKSSMVTRFVAQRINPGVVNATKIDNELERQILGQVKDPKEAYIATISELSKFVATDSYYKSFRNAVDLQMKKDAAAVSKVKEKVKQINRRRSEARTQGMSEEEIQKAFPMPDAPKRKFLVFDTFLESRVKTAQRNRPDDNVQGIEDLTEKEVESAFRAYKDVATKNNLVILGAEKYGQELTGVGSRSVTSSPFGAMAGVAMTQPLFNSISSAVPKQGGVPDIARALYAPFLKLKGLSQYAKTILSPYTQIRNVTSASMFALANGNVGKGSDLFESVAIVLNDIFVKKDRQIKKDGVIGSNIKLDANDSYAVSFLADLQKKGVIGSSANLREIISNIRQGLGYKQQDLTLIRRAEESGEVIKKSKKSVYDIPIMGGFLEKAEGLYRGGDDVWKIYNYVFEKNKLRQVQRKMINREIQKDFANLKASDPQAYKESSMETLSPIIIEGRRKANIKLLRELGKDDDVIKQSLGKLSTMDAKQIAKLTEDLVDTKAADTVRNLVPNYDLVPEAIKSLRALPLGNFIAFPAEIMRTGFNIINTALKEMSSNEAAIREIGVKRIGGALTTFSLLGNQIQELGKNLTGTSEEELLAARRLAAPYQRNSQFVPVGKDKKGNLEVIDFSHTNPYDMLTRPLRTIATAIDSSGRLNEDALKTAQRTMWETFGEFFEPFLDESMIFTAFSDVLPEEVPFIGRNGVTRSGAKVYSEMDTPLRKFEKSVIHVMNAMNPGVLPLRVPVGAEVGFASYVERGKPEVIKGLEAGRFVRGMGIGEKKEPTTGREYTMPGELFRMLTGLGTTTIDRERLLDFRAQEFKDSRSKAASIFNAVTRLESPTRDQLIEAYRRADDARLIAFREMQLNVSDLRKLGFTNDKIRQILKKSGLGTSERNALIRDEYVPYTPSKNRIRELRKKGIEIPTDAFNQYKAMRQGMKLSAKRKPTEEMKEPINIEELERFTQPNIVAEDQTKGQPVAPPSGPITPAAGLTMMINPSIFDKDATIDSSMLGGDPESILKNMQIRNRQ